MEWVLIGLFAFIMILAAGRLTERKFYSRPDLRLARKTPYSVRRVLGYEEAMVLYKIEQWLRQRNQGERVFPQVPLGTFLATPDDAAHLAIRFKRPDYVIVDRKGMPFCVVEYQGGGHYQGDAVERDQVKRAALANAKLPLVEIFAHEKDDTTRVHAKLDAALDVTPEDVPSHRVGGDWKP